MKKIVLRPYVSEASFCTDDYITDKGTSIIEDVRDQYVFQEPDYEFSDCWGFVENGKLELVDDNMRSYGTYDFREDNTNGRIYLMDAEGNETFKECIQKYSDTERK